jgi:hypothetical protein
MEPLPTFTDYPREADALRSASPWCISKGVYFVFFDVSFVHLPLVYFQGSFVPQTPLSSWRGLGVRSLVTAGRDAKYSNLIRIARAYS